MRYDAAQGMARVDVMVRSQPKQLTGEYCPFSLLGLVRGYRVNIPYPSIRDLYPTWDPSYEEKCRDYSV